MDREFKLAKYKKGIRVCEEITKILYWCCIIFSVICFLYMLDIYATKATDAYFLPSRMKTLELLASGEYILDASANPIYIRKISILLSFIAVICSIIGAIFFKQLLMILRTLKEDKPFHKDNAKRILTIGVTIIISGLIGDVFIWYYNSKLIEWFQIKNILVKFSLSDINIFIGIIVILLSVVFKYGAFLQEEYDTTL